MNRNIGFLLLFCLGSAGFVAWRLLTAQHDAAQFEIVDDPSASHRGGCESLVGLAERVVASDASGPGSTLTVLVLGDQSTASEPWRLASYAVPTIRKVLEGRSAKTREEQKIVSDIATRCRSVRRTTTSPIFLAVTQAIADLRARGCKSISHCQLFVDTDLEENVEPAIRKALLAKSTPKRLPIAAVDNAGISVVFCGVAVLDGLGHDRGEHVSGPFGTRDVDRLHRQAVWSSLFAEPMTVRFEPYCPNSRYREQTAPSKALEGN